MNVQHSQYFFSMTHHMKEIFMVLVLKDKQIKSFYQNKVGVTANHDAHSTKWVKYQNDKWISHRFIQKSYYILG